MPTLKEFVADHTAVLSAVQPGEYLSITSVVDGQTYEVMVISLWDDEIDGKKRVLKVSMSEMNNRPGFHIHFARDTATSFTLLDRKIPKFIIEPGDEAIEFMCARKKATPTEMLAVFREGDFGYRLSEDFRRRRKILRRKMKNHERLSEWQQEALDERKQEINDLQAYIAKLEREIERLQIDLRDIN